MNARAEVPLIRKHESSSFAAARRRQLGSDAAISRASASPLVLNVEKAEQTRRGICQCVAWSCSSNPLRDSFYLLSRARQQRHLSLDGVAMIVPEPDRLPAPFEPGDRTEEPQIHRDPRIDLSRECSQSGYSHPLRALGRGRYGTHRSVQPPIFEASPRSVQRHERRRVARCGIPRMYRGGHSDVGITRANRLQRPGALRVRVARLQDLRCQPAVIAQIYTLLLTCLMMLHGSGVVGHHEQCQQGADHPHTHPWCSSRGYVEEGGPAIPYLEAGDVRTREPQGDFSTIRPAHAANLRSNRLS